MQSDGISGLGGLEAQLTSKERKWRERLAARVHQMESFPKTAQEECSSLRECHRILKKDFQFNLASLDERDRELERYDVITARALALKNKSSLATEIQKQTEEYERMKWALKDRIHELEGELTLQRQEMTAAFNSEHRQQQHEFNLKMDEMRALVLSHDLKVKLLSEKAEVYCQAELQATAALQASQEFCQRMQTQLQNKEQEIKDLTAVKDCRVKELEDELKWMESKLKQEHDHSKKYEDVIVAVKVFHAQLEAQCQAHTERLQKAEEHVANLQEKMTCLTAQAQCRWKEQHEAMEKKDETIQRYKQELSAGLRRERALEQERVQVELDWQRRCEDMKAKHFLANEQLIQNLTEARHQANAELKDKKQELQDLTILLHSLNTKSDLVIQDLTAEAGCVASEEIRGLQKQNSLLRAVITQMKTDMEHLSHLPPKPRAPADPHVSHTQPVHQGAPAQMGTGSPAKSTDISSKISPAGGPCGETLANTNALTEQDVRVAHTMEQSAQLQDRLQQQQPASGLMSGENLHGAKSNPPLLHSRLKQAAFCIARLSRERQQLIEMGNRLRHQITAAGLKAEKLQDKPDVLSALEQKYKLTTQKSNKKENTPPLSQSRTSIDAGPQHHPVLLRSQLSSEESLQSLNELWEILDGGFSPSTFSEGEGVQNRKQAAESRAAGVEMVVHGISAPVHSHPPANVQQRRNPSITASHTTSRPGARSRISKIRNYNVKD